MKIFDPRYRQFEKFWNSFIGVPTPWMYRKSTSKHWENQSIGDGHGPDKFLHLTSSSYVLMEEVINRTPKKDSKILDLGCNVGRHMNYLNDLGYSKLYGVDVQHEAIKLMASAFSDCFFNSNIQQDTFEKYLPKINSDFFHTVFTHGATIELVPPTFPICKEICRVTSDAIVLLISEGGHYYPRRWEKEFLDNGFILSKLIRPFENGADMSLMSFVRNN